MKKIIVGNWKMKIKKEIEIAKKDIKTVAVLLFYALVGFIVGLIQIIFFDKIFRLFKFASVSDLSSVTDYLIIIALYELAGIKFGIIRRTKTGVEKKVQTINYIKYLLIFICIINIFIFSYAFLLEEQV